MYSSGNSFGGSSASVSSSGGGSNIESDGSTWGKSIWAQVFAANTNAAIQVMCNLP